MCVVHFWDGVISLLHYSLSTLLVIVLRSSYVLIIYDQKGPFRERVTASLI